MVKLEACQHQLQSNCGAGGPNIPEKGPQKKKDCVGNLRNDDNDLVLDGIPQWQKTKIPVTAIDQYPVITIKASRKIAGDSFMEASTKAVGNPTAFVRLAVAQAQVEFGDCMDLHDNHGQCLEAFGNLTTALRSSHSLQLDCLNGTVGVWTSISGCAEWRGCLDDSTIAIIVKALSGFVFEAPPSLIQTSDFSNVCPNATETEGTCINVAALDIAAFDCDCFDWIVNKTAAEVNAVYCAMEEVCCTWKEAHCAGYYPALIQNKMALRSEHKEEDSKMVLRSKREEESQKQASMDESLTAKCEPE